MVKLLRIACVVFGLAASSATAAPGVRLAFSDGRVWLEADGATVGQILAEWSRVGGTRIVNGERVGSQALTLELIGVPEEQALDVLLRSAGGFIAAARTPGRDSAPPNASRLDQITVLPAGSKPPANFAAAETASPPMPPPVFAAPPIFTASGGRRIIGPDGQPVPDDQEGAPEPPPSPQPLAVFPPAPVQRGAAPVAPAGATRPGLMPPAQPTTR